VYARWPVRRLLWVLAGPSVAAGALSSLGVGHAAPAAGRQAEAARDTEPVAPGHRDSWYQRAGDAVPARCQAGPGPPPGQPHRHLDRLLLLPARTNRPAPHAQGDPRRRPQRDVQLLPDRGQRQRPVRQLRADRQLHCQGIPAHAGPLDQQAAGLLHGGPHRRGQRERYGWPDGAAPRGTTAEPSGVGTCIYGDISRCQSGAVPAAPADPVPAVRAPSGRGPGGPLRLDRGWC